MFFQFLLADLDLIPQGWVFSAKKIVKESLARGEMIVLVRFYIDLIGSQPKILRINQIDL